MRVVLTATMAASVLAIGLSSAQALPTADNAASSESAVRLVQQKERGPGQATPGPGQMSPGPSPGGPAMRSPSQGGPTMGSPQGGGKMRGEGGAQFRSGERGQFRSGERGMGYGPRTGEGSRVWIGRERDRGHMGGHVGRHYGWRGSEVGPRFGYVSDCAWLRRRALETGSPHWWRRYRACIH
jgi:hypothetical protein